MRQDGNRVDPRFLGPIVEKLAARGPHGSDVWAQSNVGGRFAFTRKGPAAQVQEQPVIWADRVWLSGDVRLDAGQELLELLTTPQSFPAIDATSEELLLRAWAAWGEGSLEHVIGDFSFALWDDKEQSLWCVRDFVGARPFFDGHAPGVFCFSNTLDLLLEVPEISDAFDEVFVSDFLLEGWCSDPDRTAYRDVHRLPAGRSLKLPGYPRVCLWPGAVNKLVGDPERLPRISPTWDKRYLPLDGSHANFAAEKKPLGIIYLFGIRSAEPNAPCIEELRPREALLELVKNTYMNWLLDRDRRAVVFDQLSRIVSRTPLRRIVAHSDGAQIGALCECILEDARKVLA